MTAKVNRVRWDAAGCRHTLSDPDDDHGRRRLSAGLGKDAGAVDDGPRRNANARRRFCYAVAVPSARRCGVAAQKIIFLKVRYLCALFL